MYIFPDGSAVITNAGDIGSTPGSGRFPGERNGNPHQYCCLKISMEQRSLVSYNPWGCKRVGCNLATKQQQQMEHPYSVD